MAEPAASASGIAAVTVGLSVVSLLGVEAPTIGWALAGGWFGSSFAPKLGPVQTVVQFVLASLISALVATAVAKYWPITEVTITHLLAAAVSMSFYALKSAVLARVGQMVDRALARVFGSDPGSKQ